MRPGAPCAAAGGAPCPGSITAFWTRPLSDQRPPGPGTSGSLPNSSSRHARRTETASAPSMPCEEGAGSARRWRGGYAVGHAQARWARRPGGGGRVCAARGGPGLGLRLQPRAKSESGVPRASAPALWAVPGSPALLRSPVPLVSHAYISAQLPLCRQAPAPQLPLRAPQATQLRSKTELPPHP